MNQKLKLILIISGIVALIFGVFLTWTALYPGMGEYQELSVADYVSGETIDVSVHYPLRILIGKGSMIRVKFSPTEGLIPGSALDQELDLPGFVILPQKRLITSLTDNQKGTTVWNVVPVSPETGEALVSLALESVPNGLLALNPTALVNFEVEAYRLLGMEYPTVLIVGLIFLPLGALIFFIGTRLPQTQTGSNKKIQFYG